MRDDVEQFAAEVAELKTPANDRDVGSDMFRLITEQNVMLPIIANYIVRPFAPHRLG